MDKVNLKRDTRHILCRECGNPTLKALKISASHMGHRGVDANLGIACTTCGANGDLAIVNDNHGILVKWL